MGDKSALHTQTALERVEGRQCTLRGVVPKSEVLGVSPRKPVERTLDGAVPVCRVVAPVSSFLTVRELESYASDGRR